MLGYSDIKLTMSAYTDPQLLDMGNAVARLPSMRPSAPSDTEAHRLAAGAETTPDGLCMKLCVSGGKNETESDVCGNNGETASKTRINEKAPKTHGFRGETFGGGYRGRTGGLKTASLALYQLS